MINDTLTKQNKRITKAICSASYWVEIIRVLNIDFGGNRRREQRTVYFISEERLSKFAYELESSFSQRWYFQRCTCSCISLIFGV